jgi:hypothetical protein
MFSYRGKDFMVRYVSGNYSPAQLTYLSPIKLFLRKRARIET